MAGQYPGPSSGTQATFNYPYGMPADTLKSASLASGATSIDVWTPATGKKFRVAAFHINVTGGATIGTAGDYLVSLTDGGTAFWSGYVYIPATASGSTFESVNIDLGGGYVSSAVNNVLALTIGTALTGGHVNCTVYGNEETA